MSNCLDLRKIIFFKLNKMKITYPISLSIILFLACSPNNVKKDTIAQKYFKENNFDGSFALLNNANNDFTIYHLSDFKDSAYIPGSAFDIVNALISIQAGTITDDYSAIKIDTTLSTLNNSLDKKTLFFDSLAIKTGKNTIQFWLDSLHYGKTQIQNDTVKFWRNGNLKITSDEQLGFIKNLHFSQLPLQKRPQAIVSNLLKRESNALYNLYYNKGHAEQNGLFIYIINGWIIENKHVYFFSLTTKSTSDIDIERKSVQMLKNILTDYGFFKAKK